MSKNVQQMTNAGAPINGDLLYLVRNGNDYKIRVEDLIPNVGTGGQQDLTYTQLATLKGTGTLVSGRTYFITDRDIYVRAISDNQLETWTLLLQRLPDWNNITGDFLGVWRASLTPSVGELVAWDGVMYENTTGVNGASNPTIDTINWLGIATNDGRYNIEFAALLYDFDNDVKLRVLDKRGNDINQQSIGSFKFGHDGTARNTVISGGVVYNLNCYSDFIGNTVITTNLNSNLNLTPFYYNLIDGHNSFTFTYTGTGGGSFEGNKVYVKEDITMTAAFQRQVLDRDYSTFFATLDVTGLTTIDMTSIKWAGEITLTSSNASEGIGKITNMPNHKVKIQTNGFKADMIHGNVGVADEVLNNTVTNVSPFIRRIDTFSDKTFVVYQSNGTQPLEVSFGFYV
jgi:hypothetical protein